MRSLDRVGLLVFRRSRVDGDGPPQPSEGLVGVVFIGGDIRWKQDADAMIAGGVVHDGSHMQDRIIDLEREVIAHGNIHHRLPPRFALNRLKGGGNPQHPVDTECHQKGTVLLDEDTHLLARTDQCRILQGRHEVPTIARIAGILVLEEITKDASGFQMREFSRSLRRHRKAQVLVGRGQRGGPERAELALHRTVALQWPHSQPRMTRWGQIERESHAVEIEIVSNEESAPLRIGAFDEASIGDFQNLIRNRVAFRIDQIELINHRPLVTTPHTLPFEISRENQFNLCNLAALPGKRIPDHDMRGIRNLVRSRGQSGHGLPADAIPQEVGLVEPIGHVRMGLIHRAATDRIVRLILEQMLPSRVEESGRNGLPSGKGQGSHRFGPKREKILRAVIGPLERIPRGEAMGNEGMIPFASHARDMAKFSMEFLQLSLVTLQLPEIFSHAAMNKLDVRTGLANHTKHFRDAVRHVLVIPSVTEINQRHLRAGCLFRKNSLRPLGQKGIIVTGILPRMAQLTAKPAVAVIIGKPVRDDL